MTTQAVVDASFVAQVLAGRVGAHAGAILRYANLEWMAAPHLLDLEVTSALRKRVNAGAIGVGQARRALSSLAGARIARWDHRLLFDRIWALRDNLTPYDASYVALAETLELPLLTFDRRLARASGPVCRFEVFE